MEMHPSLRKYRKKRCKRLRTGRTMVDNDSKAMSETSSKKQQRHQWEDRTPTESTEDSTIAEYEDGITTEEEENTSISTAESEPSSVLSGDEVSSYNTLSRTSCSSSTDDSSQSNSGCDRVPTPAPMMATKAAKIIPAPTQSFKVTCVSFLDDAIPTAVASRVLDEAMRMLEPNGILYVVDRPNGCVPKCPKMRQLLRRLRGAPTPAQQQHDQATRAILQTNGFAVGGEDEDGPIVRWMGVKP